MGTADNMKLLVSSALLVGVALADPGHHGHGYRSHGYRTYGYRSHGHHGHYGKRDAEPVAVADALQRIIIPIIIFFRFHSLVMLVECWKNTYRRESAQRFETTIRRGQDNGGIRNIMSIRRNHDDNNGE